MYLQKKINQNKTIYKKKRKLKIPTLFLFLLFFPYPSYFPCPLLSSTPAALHVIWYFLQNI